MLSLPKHAQKRIKLILDSHNVQLPLSEPVTEFLVGARHLFMKATLGLVTKASLGNWRWQDA